MSRPLTNNPEEASVAAPEVVADLALDDWCEAKSRTLGRRVEALSAFNRRCQKTNVGRATPEQFEANFQAFLKMPA